MVACGSKGFLNSDFFHLKAKLGVGFLLGFKKKSHYCVIRSPAFFISYILDSPDSPWPIPKPFSLSVFQFRVLVEDPATTRILNL